MTKKEVAEQNRIMRVTIESLIRQGYGNSEIARMLDLSPKTISKHRCRMKNDGVYVDSDTENCKGLKSLEK